MGIRLPLRACLAAAAVCGVADASGGGCCFSIDYGASLAAESVSGLDACAVGRRPGGATGFSEFSCPKDAEEAAEWLSQDGAGCCVSIGYGSLMKPCCLLSHRANDNSACGSDDLLGGAVGFSSGACPRTADEVADWLLRQQQPSKGNATQPDAGNGTQSGGNATQPGAVDDVPANSTSDGAPAGDGIEPLRGNATDPIDDNSTQSGTCCFSIGFGGAEMAPCCLMTEWTAAASECEGRGQPGGASGVRLGACPLSAEEAAAWLADTPPFPVEGGCCFSIGYGEMTQPCCLTTELLANRVGCPTGHHDGSATGFLMGRHCPASVEEAQDLLQKSAPKAGCCFSIGFGSLMRPCCLRATPSAGPGACGLRAASGGASGYRPGRCPATADEAAEWLRSPPSHGADAPPGFV